MASALVYIETAEGVPTSASLELLSGARQLCGGDGDTVALVIEGEADSLAQELVAADRILLAGSASAAGYTSDRHLAALRVAVETERPAVVFLPNSVVGLDLAAAVAAAEGWPLLSYCTSVALQGERLSARCQVHGGKLEALTECPLPAVIAVNPGCFPEAEARGRGEVVTLDLGDPQGDQIEVLSTSGAAESDLDITQVERLVCVGPGIEEEDNIPLARDLAEALNGELVASRPVVDLGWVEKTRQVGKSGKTVKPKLYVAVGVSGAPEHLEGMREADLIVAINSDPTAPIFDVAHLGTTCDALDLLPVLTEKLKEAGA